MSGPFKGRITPEKYRVLPDGIYHAKLCSISDGVGAHHQKVFRLEWEILEKPLAGRRLNSLINQSSTGQRGKIWALLKALSGRTLDVFDGFDLESLIGKDCFIHVEKKNHANAVTEYVHKDELSKN